LLPALSLFSLSPGLIGHGVQIFGPNSAAGAGLTMPCPTDRRLRDLFVPTNSCHAPARCPDTALGREGLRRPWGWYPINHRDADIEPAVHDVAEFNALVIPADHQATIYEVFGIYSAVSDALLDPKLGSAAGLGR
jgi:hypothetical protein